jgi:hypothetical protein
MVEQAWIVRLPPAELVSPHCPHPGKNCAGWPKIRLIGEDTFFTIKLVLLRDS